MVSLFLFFPPEPTILHHLPLPLYFSNPTFLHLHPSTPEETTTIYLFSLASQSLLQPLTRLHILLLLPFSDSV